MFFSVAGAAAPLSGDQVDCVDPLIGAITYAESGMRGEETMHGFGKTFPGAATPFGRI